MSWRVRLMRAFLWVSVLAWGVGVGAKLYDLRVVAGAWSASPPESLTLLPYGPRFPVDPGRILLTHVTLDIGGGFRCTDQWMEDPIRLSRLVGVVCAAHSGGLGLYRCRFLAQQRCVVCLRLQCHEWG